MSRDLELIKRRGVYVCCVTGREFPPGDDPHRAARDSLFNAQMIRFGYVESGVIRPNDGFDRVRSVWQQANG